MKELFTDARRGDTFRCRDGSIVFYHCYEDGFHYVSPYEGDDTDEYGVHSDGLLYHGTGNGEPMISDLDVIAKI